jgi:hypothetical protein
MKCPETGKMISYQTGSLDSEEAEEVRRHIEICQACKRKIDGAEYLTQALSKYFQSQKLTRGQKCYDKSIWEKYVRNEETSFTTEELQEHLSECDYCFDIVASLIQEQEVKSQIEELKTPQWIQQKPPIKLSLFQGWIDGLKTFFAESFFANRRLSYAFATAAIVLIAVIGLIFAKFYNKDGIPQFPPGQMLVINLDTPNPTPQLLKQASGEQGIPTTAFSGSESGNKMVVALAPELARAIKAVMLPKGNLSRQPLIDALKSQEIELPTATITNIQIDSGLYTEIQSGNYQAYQRLFISFPEKITVRIERERR